MADQVESDTGGQGPQTFESQLAADRAAFLSEDEFAGDDGVVQPSDAKDESKKAPAKKPVQDDDSDLDDDEAKADDVEEDELDDEEETVDEDDDSDLDDEEEAPKAKVDPEVAKRLAAVRRTEERAREQITRERQKLDADRAEFDTKNKERLAKAERFEQLASRAKYNAVEVLAELGLTEDDFEDVARDIYAHSKKAASDPKLKEATARSRREREQAEEIRAIKAKLEEREKSEATQQQKAAVRSGIDAYVSKIAKSATDARPLAKAFIAKNPAAAAARIEDIAGQLALKNPGVTPDAKDVLRELERDRRQALRDLGIDPKSLQKTQTLKGDQKKAAAKGAPAKKSEAKSGGKALSFEEQKKLDREAFINGEDEDDEN